MSLKKSLFVTVTVILYVSIVNALVPLSSSANEIGQFNKRRSLNSGSALYPQATTTRDLKTLDGVWNFRASPSDPEYGYRKGWYEQDLEKVTCAYNLYI